MNWGFVNAVLKLCYVNVQERDLFFLRFELMAAALAPLERSKRSQISSISHSHRLRNSKWKN